MNVKDKLDSFSRKVMGEAAEKSLKIMAEIDAEFTEAVEEAKRQAQQKADEELRAAVYKAEQAKGQALASATMANRKKWILRRNELLDELFNGIENRLTAFTQSDDYAAYLVSEVKKTVTPGMSVRLAPADMLHAQAVAEAVGVEVTPGAEDMLGGFIAVKGRGLLDHSFRSRLEREREEFRLLGV